MRKDPQALKKIQKDFVDKEFLYMLGLVKSKNIETI